MLFLRTRLSALAVIAALFTATSAPLLASPAHAVCATKQHDCGKTAKIAQCCCGQQGQTSDQPGPVQARADLNPQFGFASAIVLPLSAAEQSNAIVRAHASRPRSSPVDLPTLFASLLI